MQDLYGKISYRKKKLKKLSRAGCANRENGLSQSTIHPPPTSRARLFVLFFVRTRLYWPVPEFRVSPYGVKYVVRLTIENSGVIL